MKKVTLSEAKDDLSRILRQAEDDWFEYRLQNDARFLSCVEAARRSLKAGHGIRIEDIDK